MGHNIKVGDKVRLTGEGWYKYDDGVTVGSIVEVTKVTEDSIFAENADDVGNSKGLYSEGNPHHWEDGLTFSVELVEPKTRFEVGDEVYDASSANLGLGRITDVREDYYRVRFYYSESNGQYSSQGDAHARREDQVTQGCVERDCICRDVKEPNPLAGRDAPVAEGRVYPPVAKNNAVDPDHYKFPNGAEVIDIVRNLDFLTGNAIKYLARAGRKGSKREDLEKALKYVEWALEDVDDVPG